MKQEFLDAIFDGGDFFNAEGERQLFAALLERRFIDVPERFRQMVAVASVDQIEQWAKRLVDGARIEAVFATRAPEEPSLESRRDLVAAAVRRQFGAVPARVRERIDQGSEADLRRWYERCFDADSLEKVFG